MVFNLLNTVHGQINVSRDRRAQTGMKFLSVSIDARAAALASAMTAQEGSAASLFYNPAGIAQIENTSNIVLGQTQWIADVTYNMGGAAISTGVGVFGVSAIMVNYGDFEETIRADNEQGFMDLGNFSPSASALGLGYGRALTNKFSVGGNIKYVSQSLGESTVKLDDDGKPIKKGNSKNAMAYDLGVIYKTGFQSLNLAMGVRNFSRELTYGKESFELPLSFRIGVAMNLMDLIPVNKNMHSLLLAIDTEHPRDYDEQLKIGGEYIFMNTLALRAGYIYPTDQQGVSLGFGIQRDFNLFGFGFDYANTQFGAFGYVNRMAINFSF